MTRLSFNQTTQNAIREMDRLEGIKKNLTSIIVDLIQTAPHSPWIKIYQQRLVESVIPALNEVKDYLRSQKQQVTKASN